MSRVWKESGFVDDDPWVMPGEDVAGANVTNVIFPFNKFIERSEKADEFSNRAVLVNPADDAAGLVPHFERLALIAVMFPAFSDGRSFSHAALLRTRYSFTGEIRAVGDVLIDQIPLMLRCGIDSFLVSNAVALKRLEEGRLTGIPLHYQPAARHTSGPGKYSWRRASRPAG